MKAYIDSSVVLRVIFGEKNALIFPEELTGLFSSDLLKIECFRTIDRMQRTLAISDTDVAEKYGTLHTIIHSLYLIKFDEMICHRACEPFPVVLKTLDAIHLATATLYRQQEQEDLLFLTHDLQLSKAAIAMGFRVLGT